MCEKILELESRKSFDFFWNEVNNDDGSLGYGLIRDRYPGNLNVSSIACIGFAFSAYVIGVERGWITREKAEKRTIGTLNTLLKNAQHKNGVFYHFLDMNTAQRAMKSEVSLIDTAILLNGAIVAGEYFEGEIKNKVQHLYEKVNWKWYRDPEVNRFYMGYTPERGFEGWWDFYGEQLMLYVLGAASPTYPINSHMFYDFVRHRESYGNYPEFIHSWFGSIFTYQYSHAWINFFNKVDKLGDNWWTNSINATKASRQFCIDKSDKYNTFGLNSWGITACDGPSGYNGLYGTLPSGYKNDMNFTDGTIAPAGAAGSIVFAPEDVISVLRNYYENYPDLWGKYGFKDSYNLDMKKEWYNNDFVGIDKGITLLMVENYRTGLIWRLFMKNKYVQEGIKRLGITTLGIKVLDDFAGNSLNNGWIDGSDGVYTVETVNELSNSGIHSLKVEYDKKGFEWAYLQVKFNNLNVSDAFRLRLKIYNPEAAPLELIFKLEAEDGAYETSINIQNINTWETYDWDISAFKDKLSSINRVLIFANNGKKDTKGIFYLDDIEFHTKKIEAINLIIDGKPMVGETLKGSYTYFNIDNISEGDSVYQWLRAEKADGVYIPIPKANSKEYIVTKDDINCFLKFQVTPKTAVDTIGILEEGQAALSYNTEMVQNNKYI